MEGATLLQIVRIHLSPDAVLFLMIFLHVIDDFCLQGIMASMKQKSWWQKDPVGSQPKYKNDYIAALFAHSFSWSFMIMLPVMLWGQWEWPILLANMFTHAAIDDAKANKMQINLIQDQTCHLIQILMTWLIFVVI